jgi:hypothetical protein
MALQKSRGTPSNTRASKRAKLTPARAAARHGRAAMAFSLESSKKRDPKRRADGTRPERADWIFFRSSRRSRYSVE